ncbi:RNA-directed DNA polymerase, eukaryota, reverse transcriptase zinc-binding domain protein [Tanacetum coccineum]
MPKQYEGSVSGISKRNESDQDTSNDENSVDNRGKKGLKVEEAKQDKNKVKRGGLDKELKEMIDEKHKMMDEELNKVDSSNKQNKEIIDSDDGFVCVEECIGEKVKNNEGLGDVLNNGKECLDEQTDDEIGKMLNNLNVNKMNTTGRTFANVVVKGELDKNLFSIPTGTKDNGDEVVIFDEDIIEERSMIITWIQLLNNAPGWLMLFNVPLQAWSVKGISVLSSRLGKPLVMDSMTANMCHKGTGKAAYARVMVEVDAQKGFKDSIEIQYKDKINCVIRTKFVKVECSWKPTSCRKKGGTKEDGNQGNNSNVYVASKDKGSDKNMGRKNVDELLKSANGYAVLDENECIEEVNKFFADRRIEVNKWNEICRKNNGSQSDSDEDVVCEEVDTTKVLAHNSKQSILCLIESIQKNVKYFCSFIYASNSGRERHDLWRDLHTHKGIANNNPWILMGDFNVTLKNNKHSSGSSIMTGEMVKFNDWVNSLELEDICSAGFFFTWTKSLKNHKSSIMKKLDRIMINTEFMQHFQGRIDSICDDNGIRFEGDKVVDVFVDHFKKFLGTKHVVKPLKSVEITFGKVLDESKANDMIKMVTDEEIKKAIFEIDSNKASGLDGYTSGFFKKACSIIGQEVCLVIRDFFMNGKLLREINATMIALIPKPKVPNKVSEFRPIACCNVIYKSISKILTNRIKNGLQKVVNLNQSAFIPGRHIHDNILIAQELLKGYKRKNGAKRCALKIDIQKAYDTVSWEFLKEVLIQFGFHPLMIQWIITYVTTSKFFICVNGEALGYFQGGRGLRQGDPISSYMFTLVMEVFSLLIAKNMQNKDKFKFHYGCKALQLTNMCFADDLLVLCNGDVESVGVIKKTLDQFSSIFGLSPNMRKSTIFFGSVPAEIQNEILQVLPLQTGNLPMKYLGVPLIAKKLVYMLPNSTISEIEKLLKGFLWCQGPLSSGKANVAWKVACFPKEQGGLGLKFLKTWNEVLLIKQLWKIIEGKESLWVKWVNVVKLKGDMKGPIYDIILRKVWYEEIYFDNKKVVDMIERGVWIWPLHWYSRFLDLCNINVPHLTSGENDKVLWLDNQREKKKFPQAKFAAFYFIWQERNRRLFKQEKRYVEQILKIITNNVRVKLMSFKVRKTCSVLNVDDMWKLRWEEMVLKAYAK